MSESPTTDESATESSADPISPGQPPSRSRAVRLAWFVAGLAIAAGIALGVLYAQASSELSQSEDALDAASTRSDQLSADLAGAREDVDRLTAEVESAVSARDESQSALETAESTSSLLQDQLTEATAALREIEGERDAALEESAAVIQSVGDFLATSLATGTQLTDEDSQCISSSLIDSMGAAEILESFVDLATSSDPASIFLFFGSELLGAMADCDVDLASLEPVSEYGDDPRLDALWDQCADGSGFACDQLYNLSPPGSAYEEFGFTCGGRFALSDSPLLCLGSI